MPARWLPPSRGYALTKVVFPSRRSLRGTVKRGDGMPANLLPTLPPDVMDCIMRAALTAEGGDVQAWVRLSLVSRAWRDSLCGASSRPGVQWASDDNAAELIRVQSD